jgi:hypothetical protein
LELKLGKVLEEWRRIGGKMKITGMKLVFLQREYCFERKTLCTPSGRSLVKALGVDRPPCIL